MKIVRKVVHKYRDIFNHFYSKKLNNKPTIISRDCIGGVLYKDFNMKFLSPTINLEFSNDDFIRFCNHLEDYLKSDLEEYVDSDKTYPMGIIKNKFGHVVINFTHYKSFDEALNCWNRRKKRVDYNNIYVIMCIGPNGNDSIVKKFESIKYKNKILLTSGVDCNKYKDVYNCKCYLNGYKDSLIQHVYRYGIKRYLNEFDWISFFNKERL